MFLMHKLHRVHQKFPIPSLTERYSPLFVSHASATRHYSSECSKISSSRCNCWTITWICIGWTWTRQDIKISVKHDEGNTESTDAHILKWCNTSFNMKMVWIKFKQRDFFRKVMCRFWITFWQLIHKNSKTRHLC